MSYTNESNSGSLNSSGDTMTESDEGLLIDRETGEIIEEEASAPLHSVSDLNRLVRETLEGEFPLVWLRGEVSNFTNHRSGHWYFSLKDKKSQVSALMFRGMNASVKFKPTVGMEVVVQGKITVYEPRGTYQFFCQTMEPLGQGALQVQYEQLKAKLKAEGLFAPARKKKLPLLPKHVGVITSPTGAAIQDIINVLRRRYPALKVTVIPAQVQGPKAPKSIMDALKMAYKLRGLDVLIVGRGGGSMEDLWGFNDEKLVRLVGEAPIPVVSAVGHEIDFTLMDFVADMRAPTPSAAAELVTKHVDEIQERLLGLNKGLLRSFQRGLENRGLKVDFLAQRLEDPQKKLQELVNRAKDLQDRLGLSWRQFLKERRYVINLLSEKMVKPAEQIDRQRMKLNEMDRRVIRSVKERINKERQQLGQYAAIMDSLSPLKVLDRGYAIARSKGKVVKSAEQLVLGQSVDLKLAQGEICLSVTAIHQ